MESEIVCMDFDGVIANTFSLSYTMHKIINPILTEDTYLLGFNDNQDNIFTKPGHNPEQEARFWHAYQQKIITQPIFPGIVDIINHLSGIYTLYIVSSSNNQPIRTFLRHHDIKKCFHDILGRDIHLSKTHKLLQIMNDQKAEPADLIMITDTLGDIKEARAAGVSSLAVSWGYHPASTLVQGKPAGILEEPDQLPGAIEEQFDFSNEYDTH